MFFCLGHSKKNKPKQKGQPLLHHKNCNKTHSSTNLGECWYFSASSILKECWLAFQNWHACRTSPSSLSLEVTVFLCCLCDYCPDSFIFFLCFIASCHLAELFALNSYTLPLCFQKKWPSLQASLLACNQVYRKSAWDSHVTPSFIQCLHFLALTVSCKVRLCWSYVH